MPAEGVLLDNSIQLQRIVYGPEETERIDQELHDQAEVYSTSFVFREFLNTIIADLEYAHIQASEALEPDDDGRSGIAELILRFGTGEGNYSQRSIQRLHLVTSALLEGFAQTRVPTGKILLRLKRTAERWIRDFFRYRSKEREQKSLVCLKELEDEPGEVERLRRAKPFPGRPRFPRTVAQFLEDRKSLVERIESEMGGKKKNGRYMVSKKQGRDDNLLRALSWLKDKNGDFDFHGKLQQARNWNWRLGDMLIALEAPDNVAVYSTDRAFVILTRALGTELHPGYRAPS